MSYYHYSNSKRPVVKANPVNVLSSTISSHKKKVKKSSGCGCGKKKIITED